MIERCRRRLSIADMGVKGLGCNYRRLRLKRALEDRRWTGYFIALLLDLSSGKGN